MRGARSACLVAACLVVAAAAAADAPKGNAPAASLYRPSAANQTARDWFQDARFGMFIHWGVYSVPARGEWVMEHEHIPVSEYEKFAPQFNPAQFSAQEIVALAKRAGMRYITITSKHHDGFAMWPTKQSRWDIVDATPYKQDPLKALATEAQRQGIKLFFYYSMLDWHSIEYWPLGRTGHFTGRPQAGDFNRYLDYMDAQLAELLGGGYGTIGGIWFDGMWDKPDADWKLERTYGRIHRLQAAALIGNNHHRTPGAGEDFQMFEQDLPGENSAGFNKAGISDLPLETCETINHSWGYTRDDKDFKSAAQLIHLLVRAAGANANFLLNIGPTAEGKVPPEFVERLQAIGAWLGTHGDTVYGTRAGPISPRSWGVTTAKGNRIYVHILSWQEPYLVLPPIADVKAAWDFNSHHKVELTDFRGQTLIAVPAAAASNIDRIVVLER
jgi:alpha-L-fucosidase